MYLRKTSCVKVPAICWKRSIKSEDIYVGVSKYLHVFFFSLSIKVDTAAIIKILQCIYNKIQ